MNSDSIQNSQTLKKKGRRGTSKGKKLGKNEEQKNEVADSMQSSQLMDNSQQPLRQLRTKKTLQIPADKSKVDKLPSIVSPTQGRVVNFDDRTNSIDFAPVGQEVKNGPPKQYFSLSHGLAETIDPDLMDPHATVDHDIGKQTI